MGFRKIIFLTFTFTWAIFYSILLFFKCIFNWITKPMLNPWSARERKIPPKCIAEPEVGTHKYIKLEDIKLHYVEAGDKSKTLMLFVHGFPEFWYSWRYQIKEFSKDYWTVAIDMRGYGDSEKPNDRTKYKLKYLIEDIKNLVKALGREKFILVGHDWGGVVAFSFVDVYDYMVEKYIIMNAPSSNAWKVLIKKNISQFFKSWYVMFFQLPYLPELFLRHRDFEIIEEIFKSSKNKFSVEDIEAYKYMLGMPGTLTAAINYYRNLSNQTPIKRKRDTNNYPQGILIFGENDKFLNLEFLNILQEQNKNLEICVIKEANHFVQQDSPKEVNDAMRTFLQK